MLLIPPSDWDIYTKECTRQQWRSRQKGGDWQCDRDRWIRAEADSPPPPSPHSAQWLFSSRGTRNPIRLVGCQLVRGSRAYICLDGKRWRNWEQMYPSGGGTNIGGFLRSVVRGAVILTYSHFAKRQVLQQRLLWWRFRALIYSSN